MSVHGDIMFVLMRLCTECVSMNLSSPLRDNDIKLHVYGFLS